MKTKCDFCGNGANTRRGKTLPLKPVRIYWGKMLLNFKGCSYCFKKFREKSQSLHTRKSEMIK